MVEKVEGNEAVRMSYWELGVWVVGGGLGASSLRWVGGWVGGMLTEDGGGDGCLPVELVGDG